MPDPLEEFLYYNKRQRKGFLQMLSIVTLLLIACHLSRSEFSNDSADFCDIEDVLKDYDNLKLAEVRKWDRPKKAKDRTHNWNKSSASKPRNNYHADDVKVVKHIKRSLFDFDPNLLSKDSLVLLGFSEFSANNIIKFRNNNGKFYKAEDLMKIYGVDQGLKQSLSPYFTSDLKPKTKRVFANKTTKDSSRKAQLVESEDILRIYELNSATKVELMSIKGIGDFYSDQIIEYREETGGFTSVDQLLDLYGMKEESFEQIQFFLSADETKIKRININSTDLQTLGRHPSIGWKLGKLILKYKSQHGDFDTVQDLKKIHVINEAVFDKMAPYLSVE